MALAVGRHLFFREISRGGWIAILALVAIVLLVRFWPPFAERVERWWRSR